MKNHSLEAVTMRMTADPIDQARKVLEEAYEVLEAVTEYEYNGTSPDHVIEEIIDVFQANFNLASWYITSGASLQKLYDEQFAEKSKRPDWRKALEPSPTDKLTREILFSIGADDDGEFIVDEQTIRGWIERAKALGD